MKDLIQRYGYVIIVIFGILMFIQIFKPGMLLYTDNPTRLVESYSFIHDSILKHKWINFWDMHDFAGHPAFLGRYQTGFWTVAILNLILGIPLILSYKLMLLISYIFPAIALYIFLKNRVDKQIALLSSLFFILQIQIVNRIIEGLFSEYFALGFLILFIKYLDDFFRDSNYKNIAVMSIMSALTVLSHPYALIPLVLITASYFAVHIYKENDKLGLIWKYSLTGALSFLILLFYLIPFIETRKWISSLTLGNTVIQNLYNSFGYLLFKTPNNAGLSDIPSIIFLSLPSLIIFFLFIISAINFNKIEQRDVFIVFSIFFIFLLSMISGIFHYLPINLIKDVLPGRLVLFLRLVPIVFIALFLNNNTKIKKFLTRKSAYFLIILLSLSLLYGLSLPKQWTYTTADIPEISDAINVFNYVNEFDNTARVFYQNTFWNSPSPVFNITSLMILSRFYTDRYSLSTFASMNPPLPIQTFVDSGEGKIFNKSISGITDKEIVEFSYIFNINQIVTVEDKSKQKLLESSSFSLEKEFGWFSVFKINNFTSSWIDHEKPLDYKIFEFTDHKIVIWINNTQTNTITVKVQQHPYWKAKISGAELKIRQNNYKLMELSIPKGSYTLELEYDSFNPVYTSISFISLVCAILLYIVGGAIGKWK